MKKTTIADYQKALKIEEKLNKITAIEPSSEFWKKFAEKDLDKFLNLNRKIQQELPKYLQPALTTS